MSQSNICYVQRWAKKWTCFAKQQPGLPGKKFSQPRDQILARLCMYCTLLAKKQGSRLFPRHPKRDPRGINLVYITNIKSNRTLILKQR